MFSLPLGLVSLKGLNLILEFLGLLNKILFVVGVLLCVNVDLFSSVHDMDLEFTSLSFGVLK